MERGNVWRWVCYRTHFRGAYLFCSWFAMPPVVYKHFIFLKFKETEFVRGMFKKKKKRTNSIFHHIKMNMETCKMKIYATIRTLGLISVSYFNFNFSWCRQTIYVHWFIWFSCLLSNAICSQSCTLIKDVDLVSGRPGFQNTNYVVFS